MAGAFGYDEASTAYVTAPKGFACLLAAETIVAIVLIFTDSNLVGWVIGGVAASITAVLYRAHERAVRKRAGTKYVPNRPLGRVVAVLLLVAILMGVVHASFIARDFKLDSDVQEQT